MDHPGGRALGLRGALRLREAPWLLEALRLLEAPWLLEALRLLEAPWPRGGGTMTLR